MSNNRTSKIEVNSGYGMFGDFVRSLPQAFHDGGTTLYVGRNIVKSFTVDGTELIVKLFRRPNFIQRIAYTFFKKSKAERAYLFASILRQRGISTPREVAFLETRQGLLLGESFFVSAPCHLPALSTLLRRTDFDRGCAGQLAAFIVTLHGSSVLHGDLNLTNILYKVDPEGNYLFTLIDTNRSRFTRPSRRQCLENLMRLTHDRPLMDCVVRRYAALRGWDPDRCAGDMMHMLDRFERRREVKKKIKGMKR